MLTRSLQVLQATPATLCSDVVIKESHTLTSGALIHSVITEIVSRVATDATYS